MVIWQEYVVLDARGTGLKSKETSCLPNGIILGSFRKEDAVTMQVLKRGLADEDECAGTCQDKKYDSNLRKWEIRESVFHGV